MRTDNMERFKFGLILMIALMGFALMASIPTMGNASVHDSDRLTASEAEGVCNTLAALYSVAIQYVKYDMTKAEYDARFVNLVKTLRERGATQVQVDNFQMIIDEVSPAVWANKRMYASLSAEATERTIEAGYNACYAESTRY